MIGLIGAVLRRCAWIAGCILLAGPALAEPYLAVREGMPCESCHVNKNGGGLRTELAITHSREILRYPNYFGWFSNPPEFMNGEINKFLRVGGDLRVAEILTFQDLGNPSECPGPPQSSTVCVDNNKVFRGRLQTNSLSVTEAVLYGEVRLIPEHLSLYIDQEFQPSLVNREAFGMLQGELPYHINAWIKAGQFFLPYGLQLQDNGAFIRSGTNGSINTGFSFNTYQPGGELGFEAGPLTGLAAVTDGAS